MRGPIAFLMLALLALAAPAAQTGRVATLTVSETAGIRRTEYPASARVELPQGALGDAGNAALRFNDADVPAQFTAERTWGDGSIAALIVDFNASMAPLETRSYQLRYGGDARPAPVTRGLAVTKTDDAIQVGNVRFGRNASPLVLSAGYVKTEFIGKGSNGIAVLDASGGRHDLSAAQELTVDIPKRGPLAVVVRYTGQLPLDAAHRVPFAILMEMPNSKSWVKMSATIQDPDRRVRSVVFESPLAFASFPVTWDFGTANNTYGAFRNAADAAVLTQTAGAKGAAGWTVQTGTAGKLQPYEASLPGRPAVMSGWGHLLDGRGAVAFAVEGFGGTPGTYSISLNGQGHTSFSLVPAQPAAEHRLVVYQHFVSVPVPIGAATSPAAMLAPLRVVVKS